MRRLQSLPLFFRRRVEFAQTLATGFDPTPYPTLNSYLYRPVLVGIWRQHELFDGTYTFADLMDAHELLDVKEKNEADFAAWREAQRR